jgi:cytidine deaminase
LDSDKSIENGGGKNLDQAYKALIEAAAQAAQHAYAPYTNKAQGAAVLTESGEIVCGSTVEIASYSASVTADIAAISQAVARGHRRFKAIAIVPYSPPSGNARQFMAEFGIHLELLEAIEDGYRIIALSDLLPHHFGPDNIELEQSSRTAE